MTKEEKIIAAVDAYNQTAEISTILFRFKCSKSWLYKWIKRYKENPTGEWYLEQSRRPKNIKSSISPIQQESVIEVRKCLTDNPYSQRGAISIQYELKSRKQEVLPIWKINRILKQANLTQKEPKEKKVQNEYPMVGIAIDQMDFVGPRYIKNDGRFYSLNIIDTSTHYVHINPIRSMESLNVLSAVVRFWKDRGIPDFLQMDNALSFRGSNRHPHSFGKLIRLALSLKITVVFIPIKEPWRNGIIEKFNDTFNKRFIKGKIYADFENLVKSAVEFEDFHNQNHRYNTHHNHTPTEQVTIEYERDLLPMDFVLDPKTSIPLRTGKIILVRFIRSNLLLNVFGEKYMMPNHLVYSYVEALIDIEAQLLIVKRDNIVQWQTYYYID